MTNVRTIFAQTGFAMAILAYSATAHASGVVAGTQIQNTASATYDNGSGGTTTVPSNTVTVKVDELLNDATAWLDGSPRPATTASSAVLTYSVTNTGNGNEAFKLTADPAVSGNPFNGTVQTIAIDSNGNGVYDPGVDTVVVQGGLSPVLAPDASVKVFVVVALPAGTTDGQISQVRLTAEANTGSGTPGTTFAGQGDGGVDAVVGTTTAKVNTLGSIIASTAAVTLTKSYTIADPFGGVTPVPGAIVTYSLKADVAGSGSLSNLHIIDSTPANTTYLANSIKLDGAPLTDAVDADAGKGSAAGIDVTLGTVAGGTSRTVTFQVKLN